MKTGAAVAVILLCLSLYGAAVQAGNGQRQHAEKIWEEMNRLAGQAWNLGKQEKFEEAVTVLQYTSKFLAETKEAASLTPEKQRVLEYSFDSALFTLSDKEETNEGKFLKVTEVMMLVDALQSDQQPLWKQAELAVMGPLQEMGKAVKQNEKRKFNLALNDLSREFEAIRPALVMDLSDEKISALDAHLDFMDAQRMTLPDSEEEYQRFQVAAADFEAVFRSEEDESGPSIFWLIFSIGGIIFSTLSYVGWRKYNGEKEKMNAHGK